MGSNDSIGDSQVNKKGKLYICPTPIGNLQDISSRCITTLRTVDIIAAEDTRRTKKLMHALSIKNRLHSLHKHNERKSTRELIAALLSGESVALVSDAGTPTISDPGELLVAEAIRHDIQVEALPGPSAILSALVLSGVSASRFVFEGYLPPTKSERQRVLQTLAQEQRTVIVFEAPHRIRELLQDVDEVLEERRIAVCRELTKVHEQVLRGTARELLPLITERGEFTVVISGASVGAKDRVSDDALRLEVKEMKARGHTHRDAVKLVAAKYDIPRNLVYEKTVNKDN